MGFLVSAFMLAGVIASPAMAQDKAKAAKASKAVSGKPTLRVLFENERVNVVEATFKPGEEGVNVARPFRVVRALKGGTIQYTHSDGKTEKSELKTGDVVTREADQVAPKNVGKSTVVLYVVFLKGPKK